MIRTRITAGLVGCIAMALIGAANPAFAEEEETEKPPMPIKQLMGENFAGLQKILIALITSNYASVPAQADVIHEHAVELAQLAPETPSADRQEFLSYAYNLDAHARDMKSIVELLIKHDEERNKSDIGATQLRGALAAHYGGMVTMCVACHNRFRPKVIE